MRRVRKIVEHNAGGDLPFLITGEVGAGKDLVAREVHRRSSRAQKPLLKVNCAALTPGFFDRSAELRDRLAGGTLLLDDVGELPAVLQEQLLEALREIDAAIDGDRARAHASFRVIAVTHHDLTQQMEAGTFCEDLYYRVNLVHVHVPPLREHSQDIPSLVEYYLSVHAEREQPQCEIPAAVLERFRAYSWPGNIRQLENAVRQLVALRDPDYVLEELDEQLIARNGFTSPSGPPPSLGIDDPALVVDLKEVGRRAAETAERQAILDMLQRTLGNKKEAAHRLGISYKALLYKMRDYGIARLRGERAEHESEPPRAAPSSRD